MYLFQHRSKIAEAGLSACKCLLACANPCQLAILCSSPSLSKSRFCAWNHKPATVQLSCYHIRTNTRSCRCQVWPELWEWSVLAVTWYMWLVFLGNLTVDWLESFAVLLKIACVLNFSSFESEIYHMWLNNKLHLNIRQIEMKIGEWPIVVCFVLHNVHIRLNNMQI